MPANLWLRWQKKRVSRCCHNGSPRTGSTEEFLSSVVKLSPKRVVYVSCGPESLLSDLKYLVRHGYKVKRCTPYDCFPYTAHIENCVLLERTN